MKKLTRDETEHGEQYYLASEVDAMLAAPQPAPDGWKWAPLEVVPGMLAEVGAMDNYDIHAPEASPDADHANWYRAMLAAAPQPPVAQPEQEPVAYIHRQGNHYEVSERFLSDDEKARGWTEEPLYTYPPQRTWVGLTPHDFTGSKT